MTCIIPMCVYCRYFDAAARGANICAAFPHGIPDSIFWGEQDHFAPYPGDHGIQFEPIDEQAARAAGFVLQPAATSPASSESA